MQSNLFSEAISSSSIMKSYAGESTSLADPNCFQRAPPRGLGQSMREKRKVRGYLSLSVLDGELDSDLETLPVAGGLADVVTDLLWGETEGTDLWGKGGSGTDFATNNSEVDLDDGGGIELWWHLLSFIRFLKR